jgi:hypothetical protein
MDADAKQTPKHNYRKKYDTEDERLKGYKEAQKRHSEKPWTCEFCNKTMRKSNKVNHERTKAHIRKACPTCSDSE